MPRPQRNQLKYKCKELACGRIIRSDKWSAHCKSEHGYKLARGGVINRTVIAMREGGGAWKPFSEPSKVRP